MKKLASVSLAVAIFFAACGSTEKPSTPAASVRPEIKTEERSSAGRWKGGFSNGMKGDKLSFDVAGNQLKNLTFAGYWRCDGKLESTTLGPEKSFAIEGKLVKGAVTESGFYYDLQGTFNGNKASGTLRMAFVAGRCDTYELKWTASKQ